MRYLVAFGMSAHHGSELSVGWQWYRRLLADGPVTVLMHARFGSAEFIPEASRTDVVLLGGVPTDPDAVNSKHVQYVYAFWWKVLQYLRSHARETDTVVIVSPAAVWFLPLLIKIPVPRRQVFYGPIGVSTVDVDLCRDERVRRRMRMRNLAIWALGRLWRMLSRLLPETLSLRFPADWFIASIGGRFRIAACVPEVEPPDSGAWSPVAPNDVQSTSDGPVLVSWDPRPRKNFWDSLAVAISLAQMRGTQLTVLGAPRERIPAIDALGRNAGLVIDVVARMERSAFLAYLRGQQPTIVALSLAEGVPSLFLEALIAGCELVCYAAGGVAWLGRFASAREACLGGPPGMQRITWDAGSVRAYRQYCRDQFAILTAAIRYSAR